MSVHQLQLYKRAKLNMGVFPRGQRGQTVNLVSSTSVVRIHPLPPGKRRLLSQSSFSVIFALRRVIFLRSDIRLTPSDIALRAVLVANIISLKPQVSISLSRSENITVPSGTISLKFKTVWIRTPENLN